MSTNKRLNKVFKSASAKEISFDDSSKFIFFSDCHRGDNSWADDFAHNQNLFFHALNYYYDKGFTYIEIGDGDELWENKRFAVIREAHSHIFWRMSKFHEENRLYLIWGNHDIRRKELKRKALKNVEKKRYRYYNEREGEYEPLFKDIEVNEHEGLILKHSGTGNKIFLVHGHQGDLLNAHLWWLSRFVVNKFWKLLQRCGIKDPTSPAKNFKKRGKVEKKLIKWVKKNHQMLIAGHTHRSIFPDEGEPPYFNDGSCVHPRCITGIEIQNGEIALIKWWFKPKDDGALYVTRKILVSPKKLESFFKVN
jgi:UDP-2,3-diacylglucosamine pyrophosphatase LpxH